MMTKKHFNAIAKILKENESKKDIIDAIALFCKEHPIPNTASTKRRRGKRRFAIFIRIFSFHII